MWFENFIKLNKTNLIANVLNDYTLKAALKFFAKGAKLVADSEKSLCVCLPDWALNVSDRIFKKGITFSSDGVHSCFFTLFVSHITNISFTKSF